MWIMVYDVHIMIPVHEEAMQQSNKNTEVKTSARGKADYADIKHKHVNVPSAAP